MSYDNPYDSSNPYDQGLLDSVQESIDSRVHGGLKAMARGSLEVLSSGFGKGLLITAAIATVAIVAGAVIAPGILFGAEWAGIGAGKAVEYGLLTAGNWLLGSGGGVALLAAGGVAGSMAAAHGENTRINKEAAAAQAAMYSQLRAQNSHGASHDHMQELDCPSGHCARLLQAQKQQEHRGHAR